ncbi:MAG: cytidine deaminase [Oscillochloris sp.]|nr:cytidine deaminase [Oscillochloris sp.]
MIQPDYAALAEAARAARSRAYAPYSHFYVGAAALTADGKIFLGGNIENAAYPMTICAERVAIFSAYAADEREIIALAVVTPTDDVASPCGACRQVIFELAPRCTILLLNLSGKQRLVTPQDLLPHGFGAGQLEEARD